MDLRLLLRSVCDYDLQTSYICTKLLSKLCLNGVEGLLKLQLDPCRKILTSINSAVSEIVSNKICSSRSELSVRRNPESVFTLINKDPNP